MKKIVFAVAFLSIFTIFTSQSFAVPIEISYQGYLTNAENVAINELIDMTFRLYVEGEPDPVWEETQEVQVNSGIYSVVLGADIEGNEIDPGTFDQQVYLGVQAGKDEEMTPRQKLTSASYSIRSETSITAGSANSANTANTATLATNANFATVATSAQNSDTVDGQHASAFAPTVHTHSGTITDADISPAAAINAAKIDDGYGSGLDADFLDGQDSTAFVSALGDTMTGQLSLPPNGLSVGTDQLVVTNNRVGIGTVSPDSRLHVSGNFKVSEGNIELKTEGFDPYIQLNSDDAADSTVMRIKTLDAVGFAVTDASDATRFVVTQPGNVGIGTTTPGQKLTVAGMIESTSGGIKFPDGTVQSSSIAGGASNVVVVDPAGSGYTSIQAAINGITPSPTNRYTIEVRPGTYAEDIVMKSHIHLKGAGMDGTIIVPKTATAIAISMNTLVDVKISGFTFQKDLNPFINGAFWGVHDTGSAFEVTECRFTKNNNRAGIYGTSSILPYIHHNQFIDSFGHAIFLDSVENSVITDNHFELHLGGSETVWLLNSSGNISRNTFLDNVTSEAILIWGSPPSDLMHMHHNIITDNFINGGINISDSHRTVIKGNRFTDGFIAADLVSEVSVIGNSILGDGRPETIAVNAAEGSIISNNIVWGGISAANNPQVTGNSIYPSTGQYGIESDNARIANNSIFGGNPSIMNSGTSEIIGNYLEPASGALAIDNSSSSATEFHIWGNRVVQDSPDTIGQRIVTPAGIRLESTGDSVVITSGGSQISIDPSGAIQITGNTVDVTAAGDLNLTGNNVNIEALSALDIRGGTTVKVESGTALDMLGGTNVKVQGSNIDIHGSGITDIQGALVKIN